MFEHPLLSNLSPASKRFPTLIQDISESIPGYQIPRGGGCLDGMPEHHYNVARDNRLTRLLEKILDRFTTGAVSLGRAGRHQRVLWVDAGQCCRLTVVGQSAGVWVWVSPGFCCFGDGTGDRFGRAGR